MERSLGRSPAGGPRRRSVGVAALTLPLALVLAGSTSACLGESPTPSPEPTPTPAPTPTPRPILIIVSPEDGDVVRTPSVQVVGTAPPGAEIVLETSFFDDRRTSADNRGDWVLTVDLEEGDNDLVFRIGDEQATTKTIRVIYEPAS